MNGGVSAYDIIRELEHGPILPTPERHRHDLITLPTGNPESVPYSRVDTQMMVDRLEVRGLLCPGADETSKAQNRIMGMAGRRYYEDAFKSGGTQKVAPFCADRVNASRSDSLSYCKAAAMDARKRAQLALGTELVPIADWVCVNDLPAKAWALKHRKAPRTAMAMLRRALSVLAAHYGFVSTRTLAASCSTVRQIRQHPKIRHEQTVSA